MALISWPKGYRGVEWDGKGHFALVQGQCRTQLDMTDAEVHPNHAFLPDAQMPVCKVCDRTDPHLVQVK